MEYFLKLSQKHKIWLLSDEAYSDFVNDDSFCSIGKLDREKKHSIIFNSISKNYGISGWRLGYAISNKELIFNLLKINQHIITCPASILEYYFVEFFDKILEITKPQIYQVVEKKNRFSQHFEYIGLKCFLGTATFYMFVSISPSKLNSEAFCDILLENDKISTVPEVGGGMFCDIFTRVSIGTLTEEEAKYYFGKIKELIEKTE